MERRSNQVAANVTQAIATAGASKESVAQAADISVQDLEARLSGETPFELRILADVGGFLRAPVARFLEGAA